MESLSVGRSKPSLSDSRSSRALLSSFVTFIRIAPKSIFLNTLYFYKEQTISLSSTLRQDKTHFELLRSTPSNGIVVEPFGWLLITLLGVPAVHVFLPMAFAMRGLSLCEAAQSSICNRFGSAKQVLVGNGRVLPIPIQLRASHNKDAILNTNVFQSGRNHKQHIIFSKFYTTGTACNFFQNFHTGMDVVEAARFHTELDYFLPQLALQETFSNAVSISILLLRPKGKQDSRYRCQPRLTSHEILPSLALRLKAQDPTDQQ